MPKEPREEPSSSSASDEDSRALDRAEELLVDIVRLAGESADALAHALPPCASASSKSGADRAVEAASEYHRKVVELQGILVAQSRQLARPGGAASRDKPSAYADALDAKLAAADASYFSGTSSTKSRKKRKRK